MSKSQKYYFDNVAIQEDAVCKDDRRAGLGHIDYNGKRSTDNTSMGQQSFVSISDKRNKRDVWSVSPSHYKEAHFATFPEELVYPMIVAGCPRDGVVLDPFMGSGTTAVVAKNNNRNYIGCELNEEYVRIAENRLSHQQMRLF